jgi:hypothetical protein
MKEWRFNAKFFNLSSIFFCVIGTNLLTDIASVDVMIGFYGIVPFDVLSFDAVIGQTFIGIELIGKV